MTARWQFERYTRLFSDRSRRAVAIARVVRFRPEIEMFEGRTLLSSFTRINAFESVAGSQLPAGFNSHQAVELRVGDLGGGSQNSGLAGNAQAASFVGDFDGESDLLTLNAASNDLTLISGYNGPNPVATTISSGGVDPRLAFTFSTQNGFDNLVVGNTGNGVLAIFEGTPKGLVLESRVSMRELRHATALEFLGMSGHDLWFYVVPRSQVGGVVEVLSLSGLNNSSSQPSPTPPASSGVAQLVPLHDSSLALIATLLPMTTDTHAAAQPHAAAVAAAPTLESITPGSFGQPLMGQWIRFAAAGTRSEAPVVSGDQPARLENTNAAAWQHYVLGTSGALDQFDRENPDLSRGGSQNAPVTISGNRRNEPDSVDTAVAVLRQPPLSAPSHVAIAAATDQVSELLGGDDPLVRSRGWWREHTMVESASSAGLAKTRTRLSVCLAITTVGVGCLYLGPARNRGRASGRRFGARRRQTT
jgi:hypothetical protein